MIRILRSRGSAGAVEIVRAIRGLGIPAMKTSRPPNRGWRPSDRVVYWGTYDSTGPQGLNSVPIVSKKEELRVLALSETPAVELCDLPECDREHLVRAPDHHGGLDLLRGNSVGYRVHKEEVVREFRIHVFGGVSVRAGVKVHRHDSPHSWIRSYEAGWKLDYGTDCQDQLRQKHRDVAKAAVRALSLDFGAVDVGERVDGTPFVFEVNRAPGAEGVTAEVYARKIVDYFQNGGHRVQV